MQRLQQELKSTENQLLILFGLAIVAGSMMFGVAPSPAMFVYLAIGGTVIGTAIKYFSNRPAKNETPPTVGAKKQTPNVKQTNLN